MTEDLPDSEIESVHALSPAGRYGYFVTKVSQQGELWGLSCSEGWALASGDDGRQAVPVWPHPAFALASAVGSWEGNAPELIKLEDWMSKWLPGLAKDGLQVAVFPTATARAVFVELSDHLSHLVFKLAEVKSR